MEILFKINEKNSLLIFDDYYLGNTNLLSKFGSNKTYKKLVLITITALLPFVDEFDILFTKNKNV